MHAGIGPALHRTLRLNQRDREVSKGRASVYFKIRTKVNWWSRSGDNRVWERRGCSTWPNFPGWDLAFIYLLKVLSMTLFSIVTVISVTLFGLSRLFPWPCLVLSRFSNMTGSFHGRFFPWHGHASFHAGAMLLSMTWSYFFPYPCHASFHNLVMLFSITLSCFLPWPGNNPSSWSFPWPGNDPLDNLLLLYLDILSCFDALRFSPWVSFIFVFLNIRTQLCVTLTFIY